MSATATATKPEKKIKSRVLDVTEKQKVSYCIPDWLKAEQVKLNTAAVKGRLQAAKEPRTEPLAIACYGPSLVDTWDKIRDFKWVMTCSGSHKFLIDRGIIPNFHLDVDPRKHKIALLGPPHKDVEYLLASTCHPSYFAMLRDGGFNVKLWHAFDGGDDAIRFLPPGELAVTGGCSVGLRTLTLAHILGFREAHVFGMDGSADGAGSSHAAEHPHKAPCVFTCEYGGKTYHTTPAILEAGRQTFHELDTLKDLTATFYGDGLVQSMAKEYVRKPVPDHESMIAFSKLSTISSEMIRQNAQLHEENLYYGVGAGKHADTVKKLVKALKTEDGLPPSVLDWGCGKGYLAKSLPFPIWEYDPCVPGKQEPPRAADLVCCLDVLEHVEPDKLQVVLQELRRCVKQIGFFVIYTGPAQKNYPDGRNTHLIQKDEQWWANHLAPFFQIGRAHV